MGETRNIRSKLSVMPLAVLLPSLGDTSKLCGKQEFFRERLEELQADKDQGTEDDVRKRLGEEGMLTQVLQWLAVEQKEELV